MSLHRICIVGLLAWVAAASQGVQALTCYVIVDAGDKTLYRATVPPFALAGPAWDAAQTRMRAQQNYFMWFDAATCAEDHSSPLYAGSGASRDANSILAARSEGKAAGIFTGTDAGSDGPTARGQQVIVGPRVVRSMPAAVGGRI